MKNWNLSYVWSMMKSCDSIVCNEEQKKNVNKKQICINEPAEIND